MADSLAATASAGDRGATLRALRDRIAKEIDLTNSARDVAALSRQLTEVLAEIESLPNPEKVSVADEIAKRRADRRAGAQSLPRPQVGK